jgi:ADP-heptose:LPS heptosyltransferase
MKLIKYDVNPDNFAVLIPCSAHENKCWPIENFAELATKVSRKFAFSIVATGTDSEKSRVEILRNMAGVPVVNFAGETNLIDIVELLRLAKLVVSNDTGPSHIAAALGKPLVLIFGPTNPNRVGPYKREDAFVAVEPNKRGLKLRSRHPRHNTRDITVEMVYEKICQQLC